MVYGGGGDGICVYVYVCDCACMVCVLAHSVDQAQGLVHGSQILYQ